MSESDFYWGPSFSCQVCGYEADPAFDPQKDLEEWCVHCINIHQDALHILTCPNCADLEMHQVFEGYKRRIREGFVEGFH